MAGDTRPVVEELREAWGVRERGTEEPAVDEGLGVVAVTGAITVTVGQEREPEEVLGVGEAEVGFGFEEEGFEEDREAEGGDAHVGFTKEEDGKAEVRFEEDGVGFEEDGAGLRDFAFLDRFLKYSKSLAVGGGAVISFFTVRDVYGRVSEPREKEVGQGMKKSECHKGSESDNYPAR